MRRILLLALWISLFTIMVQASSSIAQQVILPEDSVWGISWSPDGARIAAGRLNGLIEIRNSANGQVVQSLQIDPPSDLVTVAWSPDGSKLAATAMDRLLYIWDMSSGQLLHALQGQNANYLTGVSWSPGSDQIAAISQLDGRLEIWNASTGALLIARWAGTLAGIDWIDNSLATGTGPGVNLSDATTGQFVRNIGQHDAYVITVAWSPDGHRIASGGMDGTVRIWDAQTNLPLHIFSGYTLPVTWVDWSPDGTKIAGASYDGSIRVWDTITGQSIEVLRTGAPVLTVQWSPDGGRLAYSGDVAGLGSVVAVVAAPGVPTPTPTPPSTNTFTPEPTPTETTQPAGQQQGKILFPWWDNELYVANSDGSDVTLLAEGIVASGPRWSPDGTRIAYVRDSDEPHGEIYVMNADGSNPVRLTDDTALESGIAWSPDGSRLAYISDRDGNPDVFVMNADGSNPVNLTNHPARDAYPGWSPDGARIVFGSDRDGNADLYVMNADGSNPIRLTNDPAGNTYPSWSPDGTAIAFRQTPVESSCERVYTIYPDGTNLAQVTGSVCELVLLSWLPDSSGILYQHLSDIYAVTRNGSSQTLFASLPKDGPVGIADIFLPSVAQPTPTSTPTPSATLTPTATPTNIPTDTPSRTPLLISDLDWSSDGSRIAVGFSQWQDQYQQSCGDGEDILLVDATTGQTTSFPRPDMGCSPSTVDFDTTGTQILVASASTYEIWDLVTGQRISAVSRDSLVQAASWSPDETEVLVTSLSLVHILYRDLIDEGTGFLPPRDAGFSGLIYSAWSPDGHGAASTMDDGRIYVWSATDAQILATFQGHNAPAKRLAWNPVSNVIASGDDSGIIWIWDATTGQPIWQLNGHTGIVYDLAWHPNGEVLVSAGADNTVRVWNVSSGVMRIVDSSEPFSAVAYSPDGTELAYAGAYSSLATPIEIVPAPSVAQPTSTPTSMPPNAFIFTRVADDRTEIFSAYPDGSHMTSLDQINNSFPRGAYGGDLSPDGTTLVFSAVSNYDPPPGGRPPSDIYTYNFAADSLTQLTSGEYDNVQPVWSPDGSKIAYFSQGENHHLTIMDVATQQVTTIPDDAVAEESLGYYYIWDFDWAPSGDQLVMSVRILGPEGFGSLYTVSVDGTTVDRILPDGVDAAMPKWGSNVNEIYVLCQGPAICRYNLPDQTIQQLTSLHQQFPDTGVESFDVSPQGDIILGLRSSYPFVYSIVTVDPTSGEMSVLHRSEEYAGTPRWAYNFVLGEPTLTLTP